MAYTAAKLLQASGPGERRNHDRAYARGDLSKGWFSFPRLRFEISAFEFKIQDSSKFKISPGPLHPRTIPSSSSNR